MTSYTIFLILILIIAIALILIVMVQNPKGGGLSSTFGGGGSSIGGVQSTNNFLDRTTWTLAIAMFALILLANFAIPRGNDKGINIDNTLNEVNTVPAPSPDKELPPTTNDSE